MNFAAQLDPDLSAPHPEQITGGLSSPERLSLLVDGEILPSAAEWTQLQLDPENRNLWRMHQLIGDLIRSPELLPVSANFSSRVMQALESEPVILAPGQANASQRGSLNWLAVKQWSLPSLAVAAAAAAVIWVAVPQVTTPSGPAVTADNKQFSPLVSTVSLPSQGKAGIAATAVADLPAQTVNPLSISPMDRYLIAHQQVSPSTSRHAMLPMVRITTVSAENR